MKKFSFLCALLCASLFTFADPELVYDVNFALASNGSSAEASSGNAGEAIDGNEGTRWESAQTDDETWTLNMGQQRIFNTIKIKWEGAFAKEFTLTHSNDGENWTVLYVEENLTQAGWQTIELTDNVTAQYIKYHGTKRATQWGQSFFEFQVFLPGVSTLTKINLSAAAGVAKVGEGVNLTLETLDQNDNPMDANVEFVINPTDAGEVSNGKYIPAKVGSATIVAKSGELKSQEVAVFGYEGDNLVLSTNIASDNKIIAQSDFAPDGTDAFHAVDGNEGSVWQGSATNGTADDEASRTFDAWFVADLGAYYDIDLVTIHFEGACAQDYHVDFSADNSEWSVGYNHTGTAGVYGRTDYLSSELTDKTKVRYVRFWSTKAATQWGMKIFEFQVFGREWVDSGDTEAPVMVSAELVSKVWNAAVIAVEATDNHEVVSFRVVDAAKHIDSKLNATDGKITVSGLTAETEYNFTITAFDAAGNESENSKDVAVTTPVRVIVPATSAPAPTWPAAQVKSIYSDAYHFAPEMLVGYNQNWWDNPNMTEEAIGEDHFLHYDLYRNGMIGAQFGEISVLSMEKVHIDIFASAAGSITFRLITNENPAINVPKTLELEAEKWNSFDIDLADFGEGHDWATLYQFAIEKYQAGGLVGEHISVDNIYLYRTTAIVDNEKPTNVVADKVSEGYFSVVLALSAEDNSGVVNFSVLNGEDVLATTGGASGATVNVNVLGLAPNTEYNLSVVASDDAGNEADAVAVPVKTLATPAPAPAPDFSDKDVVAVFCDALENNPAIQIGAWGQSTQAQVVELAENDHVFFLTNFNYLGWELTPAVNATDMQYLHVDVYTKEMTSVSVTPISPNHELPTAQTLVPGQWNSLDINLNVYASAEIAWDNIFQFKFDEPVGGKELFIDNVFFFKPKTTSLIENNINDAAVVKFIENGTLFILRAGQVYTIQGTLVR